MIERTLEPILQEKEHSRKAIVLMGARQVGKTTLLKKILAHKEYYFLNADDYSVRELLTQPNTEEIRTIIGDHTHVFIDEAQRVPDIGLTLKIIIDQFPHVQLYVSGSSSFDLGNRLQEPLTGRKWEYELFPISWEEYEHNLGYLKSQQQLENRLIYGMYPEVINNPGKEAIVLRDLVNSYLYKDILAFAHIRKPEILEKLVQALALQVGSEVNYNELAQLIQVNKSTIQSYIQVLEKGYLIFRISSFSRNLRNEIKRNRKIYFYDNGIRNAIINNINQLDLRTDKGALWENFLMSERRKYHGYHSLFSKMYFWRNPQKQEVDCVEEKDGRVRGYEFKWKEQKVKLPKTFTEAYNAEGKVIHRGNFREFVMPSPSKSYEPPRKLESL